MNDKCSWPGCQAFYTGVFEKRPLCDAHTAEVLADGKKGVAARAKIGLRPMPVIHGVPIRGRDLPCSVCGTRAFYLVGGVVPVCAQHMAPGEKLKGLKHAPPAEEREAAEPEPAAQSAEPELSSWAARLANGEFD